MGSSKTRVGDNLLGRPQAVAVGHPDVHQHHIGAQRLHLRNHVGTRAGLAHHLEVGLGFEQASEAPTDQLLVVGDHHPDHGRSFR